jgi:uncharacterized protein with HEPN domain
LIETWVSEAGGSERAILSDPKTRSAIERQLLVISEAAIRLHRLDTTATDRLAPDLDWSGIRAIGNILRHKYDDIDTAILINVIRNRLTELKAACDTAFTRLNEG